VFSKLFTSGTRRSSGSRRVIATIAHALARQA
jgi:hypothetical protein